MTYEEYKKQPFKYGSNSEVITNEEMMDSLSRRARREIQKQLKKGRYPSLQDYLHY